MLPNKGMKNTIKRAVNSLFGLAGLAVCSRDTLQKSGKFDGIRGRYLKCLEPAGDTVHVHGNMGWQIALLAGIPRVGGGFFDS